MADSVSGLFPKKISVMLTHAVSGHSIGVFKFNFESLPEKFDKPTILEVEGCSWRITEVETVRSGSYLRGKKLNLFVQEAASFRQENRFNVPTMAGIVPTFTDKALYNDFSLILSSEDWRQLEFMPRSQLLVIQDSMKEIESILLSPANVPALLGYDRQYLRSAISLFHPGVSFQQFCESINCSQIGNVRLGELGFVENGFSIRSDNYVYYGEVENDKIRCLCLQQFESADDEFLNVVASYGLVLCDWCNANILMHEINMQEEETPVKM